MMRLDALPLHGFADAAEHLEAEFRWLDGRLAAHVRRLRTEGRFNDDAMRGLYLRGEDVFGDLARPAPAPPAPDRLRGAIDARAAISPQPPLHRIAAAAGLDPLERTALLLVAAPALDRRYRTAFAYAQNDASRGWPTVDLLTELLWPDARIAGLGHLLGPAPLIAQGLVHVLPGEETRPFADRALGMDERVLAALAGLNAGADHRLAPYHLPVVAEAPDLALAPLAPWQGLLLIEGEGDAGQRQIAARALRAGGLGTCLIEAGRALEAGMAPMLLGQLAGREALLGDAGLILELRGTRAAPAELAALLAAVAGAPVPIAALLDPGALAGERAAYARHRLDPPPPALRRGWWQSAGAGAAGARLAWTSGLGADGIAAVAATAPDHWEDAAARISSRPLPPVLEPVPHRWHREELVLPAAPMRQLDELIAFAAHAPAVVERWGFARRGPQARRCVALFAGPSGTGKTMAASIVARAAGLPLYRANLAAVFDKYIGETEKQLDRLFTAATEAGVALLFDEADVLFGTRTETRDAHDRYANLSTAYILQRLEAHEGLVVLASNLPRNMDAAFARRLTHSIAFPLPDEVHRALLWRHAFPPEAELAPEMPWAEIAETFELSGGNIANAALAAAYLAAADGGSIAAEHLLRAIARELEKTGRAPIAADFGRLMPPA